MTPEEKSARKAGKSLITRARRAAFTALDVYRQEVGANLDFDDDLTNLLTALHHLADNHNLDWKELLWSAKRGYQEDRAHARKPKQAKSPAPLEPPAAGLHPAPLTGPRRADEIAWVRNYLMLHIIWADVPAEVQPNTTELDRWAAQIVDHLVRGMIPPPVVVPIDPTQNAIRWMVGDHVRINKPDSLDHKAEGIIDEVRWTGVRLHTATHTDLWFAPEELLYISGRPDNPAPKPEQLHANAVRAAAAAFPDPIALSEALAESQRAAENAASWEAAWPGLPRPATPDEDGDEAASDNA